MQKLTYEEVKDTIENIRRFGNLTGVEISRKMLEDLGNPQSSMNLIHIAGTNGKGSVSAFLCAILQEAGLKVGMFTSPHLVDFRERIQINGKMISKEDCARLGNFLLEKEFGVHPTMFDYCMVMAVLYFKEQQCDVIIMETGLGGTCDSTNALGTPEVTVITKIGYDHMAILGDTLGKIASEKAGIIKKETTLIVESQEKEAEQALRNKALEMELQEVSLQEKNRENVVGTYCFVDREQITKKKMTQRGQTFSFLDYPELSMHILGVHQYENAAASILAAEAFIKRVAEGKLKSDSVRLRCMREAVSREKIKEWIPKGIAAARWMGRMEILSESPFFMVDGAHNSHGVTALCESLQTLFPGEKFHFIMAVMADKDYDKMIECLLPIALDFVTVTADSSRALQGEVLAEFIRGKGIPARNCESFSALELTKEEKTIAFGSLYFIGEIEALYQ
ncbi:MAG: bifunctional folylpolyglutamate synthase/dihydrofolate synthase [Roseburia sp.]